LSSLNEQISASVKNRLAKASKIRKLPNFFAEKVLLEDRGEEFDPTGVHLTLSESVW
jgi:hypothetical protein